MSNHDDEISKSNIKLDMRLFSHIIVMGIDTNLHGFSFYFISFLNYQKIELTYEKIFNNTIDASIIDIYPPINKQQLPRYLENYKLVSYS